MNLREGLRAAAGHGMRAYYVPAAAGLLLAASAFLPWVLLGETPLGGVPGIAGLWILGLGSLAVLLATLSIITRKNSRHPLLVVGLAAFAILFLSYRLMARSAEDRAWAVSEAVGIVDDVPVPKPPAPSIGSGVYLGLVSAGVLVLFGLTIVIKRASKPYAEPEDE